MSLAGPGPGQAQDVFSLEASLPGSHELHRPDPRVSGGASPQRPCSPPAPVSSCHRQDPRAKARSVLAELSRGPRGAPCTQHSPLAVQPPTEALPASPQPPPPLLAGSRIEAPLRPVLSFGER